MIPGFNRRPRVVLSPLRAHGSALAIGNGQDWTTATKTNTVINAASFDYGGFGLLLHNSADVLAQTLSTVPYMENKGTEIITDLACREAAEFLGFEYCQFVSSGYTMNLVAFPAMHDAAAARGKKTLFLMDGSSHNSMMIGSFISTGAKISRFEHNNVDALEAKLIAASAEQDLEIIVGIEGNYSMEGGFPPLPAIVNLKRKYNFKIYIDEAHSFLAVGKSGRGIVEHYQDLGHDLSFKDIDCIGATMSKSVGTLGGILVMHDRAWFDAIAARMDTMSATCGGGCLLTVIKMRLLQIIRKPTLVAQRMSVLRQHTVYILESLYKSGLCIHSDYMSPVIVVITVSYNRAARFADECHRLGLAITMAGPPATGPWQSVGRMCINALLSKEDVEQLVRIIVQAAVNLHIVGPEALTIVEGLRYNFIKDDSKDALIASESIKVDQELMKVLRRQQLANMPLKVWKHPDSVLAHGIKILHSQGLGATSNRLYWGSLLAHVQCEQRLTAMYTSFAKVVEKGRVASLIMTESRNTISSTVAACISPLQDKSAYHLVLLPSDASLPVKEAIKSMRATKKVVIAFYESESQITTIIESEARKKTYVTLYRHTTHRDGSLLDLEDTMTAMRRASQWTRCVTGFQLILDDFAGFGVIGPRKLGYLDAIEARFGDEYLNAQLTRLKKPTRLYLMGSFYNAFNLQGGFVIAAKPLIKLLFWTSRASMFATAPLPCNVGMAEKMIESLMTGQQRQPAKSALSRIMVTDSGIHRSPSIEHQVELLAV